MHRSHHIQGFGVRKLERLSPSQDRRSTADVTRITLYPSLHSVVSRLLFGAMLFQWALSADLVAQDTRYRNRLSERNQMVENQILARNVNNPNVLKAMEAVPRHRFVPEELQDVAYADTALPIGQRQTISQPYIVAYMTQALQLPPEAKVLEIGTGSGYQTAILAELAKEVYTIEIVQELAVSSRKLLSDLGYKNIYGRQGDGYQGWPEHAPFDAIIVTAAPSHVPPRLVEQLAEGARLVIPVGEESQAMTIVTKTPDGSMTDVTIPVRFVPMTGEAMQR